MKLRTYVFLLPAFWAATSLSAQTEVMAWGNMTGIRVEGQLMEFESSFRVVGKDWSSFRATGKEKQSSQYHREGETQIVTAEMERVNLKQVVTDQGTGQASVSLEVKADTTFQAEGIFFCLDLPEKRYSNGSFQMGSSKQDIADLGVSGNTNPRRFSGKEIVLQGTDRTLRLSFPSSVTAFIRKEEGSAATLYIECLAGTRKGKTAKKAFTIQAEGVIDHSPVHIALDTHNPGRRFEGLGGNFRLQNPAVDPQVITYCLDSLRVAWGRVEMPWRNWQPDENTDPLHDAQAGNLPDRVREAMQMAQRLAAKGMPVIVSAWFPPEWAILGDPKSYVSKGGVQAFRLDPAKQEKIYKSLADYLVCLKQYYGVEAVMFSFNESDLGIDVLHTPQEHADFIKGLGAHMASRGLATTMLLGDNSDATTFDFILPAMNDPETHKYIGAVSFHSWRGCDDATLHKWAGAARKMNLPLLVGEGSTDASAHRYAEIFAEPTFAFYEINLYVRLCSICQPLSILQWQLTSDYSILWGDGVYGSTGPLRPTQRFWNLKQLASTPEQSFALPFTCDKEEVNCAAFGNIARGEYAVHLVNNGASREATLQGLPKEGMILDVYVTNKEQGMKPQDAVSVKNGQAIISLPANSFITLLSRR